jgi:hypothetical protein
MLHKINRPQSWQQMENLLRFQKNVLSLLCDPKTPVPLDDVAAPHTALLDAFHAHLGTAPGDWFWSKRGRQIKSGGTLLKALKDVVVYVHAHPAEGPKILTAFHHDTEFHTFQSDTVEKTLFTFDYHTQLTDDARKVLKPLFQAFYTDLLAGGFPASIHGFPPDKFDRDSFITAFWEANKEMRVCPACDGPRSDTEGDKHFDDADHYLPKSEYPFFSLHPANLVPLCLQCNRTFKGDRDPADILPLTPQERDPLYQQTHGPLTGAFFPYAPQPAISELTLQVSRTPAGERQMCFEDRNGMPSRRAASYTRVFHLPNRWTDPLDVQIKSLRNDIKGIGIRDAKRNRLVSETELKEDIEDILQRRLSSISQQYYFFVQTSYLRYALSDNDEFDELYSQYLGH